MRHNKDNLRFSPMSEGQTWVHRHSIVSSARNTSELQFGRASSGHLLAVYSKVSVASTTRNQLNPAPCGVEEDLSRLWAVNRSRKHLSPKKLSKRRQHNARITVLSSRCEGRYAQRDASPAAELTEDLSGAAVNCQDTLHDS